MSHSIGADAIQLLPIDLMYTIFDLSVFTCIDIAFA